VSFIPQELEDQLLIPSDVNAPNMAVISLWTRKEIALRELTYRPAVIGQLYSARRGIPVLLRNLWANPQITQLQIVGEDLSGSGQALWDLLRDPDDAARAVCGLVPGSILANRLQELAESLHVTWQVNREDSPEATMVGKPSRGSRERLVIPPPPPLEPGKLPGLEAGATFHSRHLGQLWLKCLRHIRQYGVVSNTQFGQRQQEIFGMQLVWRDTCVEDWVPVAGWEKYGEELLSSHCPPGLAYTYGNRLRQPVDQLQEVIEKLRQDPDTRAAVVSLWLPEVDGPKKSGTPCLITGQFRIIDGRLLLLTTIRSNDMFSAWPYNVAGFRVLHRYVLDALRATMPILRLGDLITVSGSAHIYEDCWNYTDELLSSQRCERALEPSDPFGNWQIELDEGQIKACLIDSDADAVCRTLTASTAREMHRKMLPLVQSVDHALYLGRELGYAEARLLRGEGYRQDRGLR